MINGTKNDNQIKKKPIVLKMYDAVIIGAGPGGYTCAIRIAQLGGKAVLIEENEVGGVCTNKGCIPTKTLWSAIKLVKQVNAGKKRGINTENLEIDYEILSKYKDRVVKTNVKGIETLLESNNIDLIRGKGKIINKNTVRVGDKDIKAKNIVIATGSEPVELKDLTFDHEYILSSEDVLALKEIPSNILIVGGGVIGVEFAAILNKLGSKVTIVELADKILPLEDQDISDEVEKILGREISIYTNSRVSSINQEKKEVEIKTCEETETIQCEKILVAVGRRPRLPAEIDEIGIKHEKEIPTTHQMKTNIENIYAIGDITDSMQLAHVASHEGITAAENIMGNDRNMNYDSIPGCIFSLPEVARVGLTERQARELTDIQVGMFPYAASGKARCEDTREGFVKTIIDEKTKKILGIHIIGQNASDLIAEATIIVKKGLKTDEIQGIIHAHPTLPEMIEESIQDSIKKAINLPKK